MEQMKSQWYMVMHRLNLTRFFAKILALGWYEYEQAKEDLESPKRIEHNSRLLDYYESQLAQDKERQN